MRNSTALDWTRAHSGLHLWRLLVITVLFSPLGISHPDVEVRIGALTEKIEQDPPNAALYLKRGELHREHRDWGAALADYEIAFDLDPKLGTIHLARGLMWLDAGRLEAARSEFDRFLGSKPNHSRGLIARARTLARLGGRLDAAANYDRGIAHSPRPTPQLYLERAHTLAAEGEEHFERALHGLDEGMQKLGRIVTLQSYAIELERKRRRYDAALERLGQVARWLTKERFLQRQGDILREAGRQAEARQAYTRAVEHIDSLAPRRKTTGPIVDLRVELLSALQDLEIRVKGSP